MLLVVVAFAVAMTVVLAWPFIRPLLLAAVLAGGLRPAERWLARLLHGHRGVAALLLTFAVLFAFVLPLGGLLAFVVREALRIVAAVQHALAAGGTDALAGRLPVWLQASARHLLDEIEAATKSSEGGLQSLLAGRGGQALAAIGGILATTRTALGVVLRTALMLIALYFLLVDGARLTDWLEEVSPLRAGELRALLGEMRSVSVTVLRSTVLTGLVQSVVATVGYLIAGAPEPVFLGLMTFFISLVPALGATIGCLAVALLLLAMGHSWAGLFLALWGLGVVGVVDNVVKPLFIRGGVDIHGAVIFFALLGGVTVFGPIGIIAGPLIVAFLLAVLRLRERERPLPLPGTPLERALSLPGEPSKTPRPPLDG